VKYTASDIDLACQNFRDADWSRSKRRALINSICNGAPPFSEKQQQEQRLPVNFNDLTHTRELHNARAQMSSAIMKPGAFFIARTDAGAKHKRDGYGRIVTKDIAKIMKRSLPYFESLRSKVGSVVLHGISPSVHPNADGWRTRSLGVEDAYLPGNTELMDIAEGTLPRFALYRSLKVPALIKLAKGPRPDPAWNQPLVDACIKWCDDEMMTLASSNWSEFWSPEKAEERYKSDGACYSIDRAPTVNVFDFYYWDESKEGQGWKRRMILDAWSMPDATGLRSRRTEAPFTSKDQFLYNPGDRIWADNLSQIINFQFADLSAVFPAQYHSVRSLGYLLYAVCQVQNRLNCKFTASMFEQLMVLMRIKTQDDAQRALAVNFVDYGFVDDSIDFIPAAERYQVNAQLAQLGLSNTQNLISRSSSSFTSKVAGSENGKIPTATQWMGEEQKVTQLVSAGFQQFYEYQKPEYREIFRRFTKKDSSDADVREFQAKVLKQGVPEKVLYNLASWDIEPERIVGSGNKTLEMMTADWLVNHIQMYEPDAQTRIKKIATLAVTDDSALTDTLVPDAPQISNSVHDAQMCVGTLLIGQPMEFRQNVNHNEYAMALIGALQVEIQKVMAAGGVPESQAELIGLQNLAGVTVDGQPVPGNGAMNHIMLFGQDPENKAETKQLNDQLGKLMNEVKAFAQRFQEQQQSQNGSGAPQLDPETQQKIISMQAISDAKAENNKTAHAQKTAQRQVSFEMQHEQKQADAALNLQSKIAETKIDLEAQAAKAQLEISKEKKKAESSKKKPPASDQP
jgi:hypothetical protein